MRKTIFWLGVVLVVCMAAGQAHAGSIWLKEVISFTQPSGSSSMGGSPGAALGPADAGKRSGYVSIDTPETLILKFAGKGAGDGQGKDIRIFEYCPGDSSVDVFASMDNRTYVHLGMAKGTMAFDIADYRGLEYISYLKFVGLDNGGKKTAPGFDLDAVKAFYPNGSGGGSEVPIPGALWLFVSGLMGLATRRKRR